MMMVLLVQELEAFSGGVYPLMGFDFLHASNAKNLATNLAPFVYLCLREDNLGDCLTNG
jgi:hypothetical protein